ncbi:Heme-binding protein 2 [Liparis tanakae]|uniref:Heme-binding protein 2 n=1 Tax=Liparis tanakae TaxID=230148 RepID=A0A4Z2FSV0_9TELE|nr:Heme-binding protein 2 [Liparis tanakae]
MIYLSGFVGFLLVLTAEARVGNSSELNFCTETEECLLFDLICRTDDYEVFINNIADMQVYVRSYGGWMMSWTDKNQAETLSSALKSAGAEFDRSFHYGVGYNSPMMVFNRHNEVWYVVQDDPVCGSSSEEMELSPIS